MPTEAEREEIRSELQRIGTRMDEIYEEEGRQAWGRFLMYRRAMDRIHETIVRIGMGTKKG